MKLLLKLDIKLKYLDKNNEHRRTNAEYYYELLKNNNNIILPKYHSKMIPVYHVMVIQTIYRDKLKAYLADNNIETSIHYPTALSEEIPLKMSYDNKNCIELSKTILSLPMYPELTKKEIKYVCDKINSFSSDNFETKINPNKIGDLHCINNLSFNPVKRIFYIDNFISKKPMKRGNHAIINFKEFLFIVE